jgi:hypothetical protein
VLRLQRLASNAGVGTLVAGEEVEATTPSPVLGVVGKGGGMPLPAAVRTDMEHQPGADLSDVRVHDGGAAASSAAAVQGRRTPSATVAQRESTEEEELPVQELAVQLQDEEVPEEEPVQELALQRQDETPEEEEGTV